MRKLNKKGYYFVIDALIGSTIIFLSLMIIINGNTRPTAIQYNYEMAEEYSTFLLNTKIHELSNLYVDELITSREINDTSLTVMEQINLFYYYNKLHLASNMTQNLTEPLIPEKYGFSYTIMNDTTTTVIYSRTSTDISKARVVIASRKITFLQINSSTMFGPAMTEIKLWI